VLLNAAVEDEQNWFVVPSIEKAIRAELLLRKITPGLSYQLYACLPLNAMGGGGGGGWRGGGGGGLHLRWIPSITCVEAVAVCKLSRCCDGKRVH